MSGNHIRTVAINVLLVLLATTFPLLGLEYLFRIIRVLSNKPPYYQSDSVLGWSPIPKTHIDGMPVVSSDGTKYRISFSTDDNGLRFSSSDWLVQPSGHSLSQRTLVLGDSFTGDAYTSDKDAWFAYLNKELSLPVYAYGIGGSGTYQQYLSLRRLLPLVRPNIVILQACSNDHGNNDPSFIFSSNIRNQELRRPYLSAEGYPFYAQGLYAFAYRLLFAKSQLFAFVDNQLAKKGISLPFSDAYTVAKASSALLAYGGSSEGMTSRALELFVDEARSYDKNISLFGVVCNSEQASWWKRAYEALGVTYFPEPALAVDKALSDGKVVTTEDSAHWNILGNEIFGNELVRQIKPYLD